MTEPKYTGGEHVKVNWQSAVSGVGPQMLDATIMAVEGDGYRVQTAMGLTMLVQGTDIVEE